MRSVREWLEAIGLEEYFQRFADHRISMDVLPDLGEADLEKLDIPLGDRKRLMRAITQLRAEEELAAAVAEEEGSADLRAPGQLRQITVCFIDLAGSTELAAELDLEEYKDLIRSYHLTCARLVSAHGGYVAQYAGDGVMAYFGYPRAKEDDPERAVLAGLAIVRDVSAIAAGQTRRLAARAGIATGQVLIGELTYGGNDGMSSAMGEIPNLAARLQALAEPGQVMIAESTRRLLGTHFVCEDAGRHVLKGFRDPVPVWRVAGVEISSSRFEARQRGSWTAFVNREEEMGLLGRRWERARVGHGNAVLLSGEPGIGKSRLARELANLVAGEPHKRLQFQCSAHNMGSTLYPITAHLEYACGFATTDTPAEKLEKLQGLLSDSEEDMRDLPLFAKLMSLPLENGGTEVARMSGPKLREATLEALIRRMFRLAAEHPLLVIFEDLHWIDPTTQELLDLFIERIAGSRILLLCTFRHEYRAHWLGLPHVTRIEVNRLDQEHSSAIVAGLMEGRARLDAAIDAIVEKTDGVPLFIEELTKAALESATVEGPSRSPPRKGREDPLALPSTLKDSLMARLDRLPLAEKVMPVGAAIGRSFSYRVLAAVTGLDRGVLVPALTQLVDAELLFQRGEAPDAIYTFKHALVQDVAYETVLKSRMRELHARIAATIEESFPQVAENQPEVVAHHYAEASLPRHALPYWERAANQATARSANIEAIAHLEAALKENERETDAEARAATEMRLREKLCVPLEARGWGSTDIETNLARLHELVSGRDDDPQLFTILHGLFGTHLIGGSVERAREYALRMREIAEGRRDAALMVLSRHALGMSAFLLGELDAAVEHFDAAIRLRPGVSDAALRKYYVADPEVVGRAMQAWAEALRAEDTDGPAGRPEAALDRAATLTEATGHAFTRAYGLSILASACQTRGEPEAAADLARQALELSRDEGFTYWEAWSGIVLGWSTAMTGGPQTGIEALQEGLTLYTRTGSRQIVPYAKALLAEACLYAGRVTEALAALEEIDEMRPTHSVRFYDRRIEGLRAVASLTAEAGSTTRGE